jgi:ketosteroid isomerase-like protein
MKYVLSITTMLVLFSCSEGETKTDDDVVTEINESEEIELIEANVKQFSEHVMNGDFQAVGEMYTEDAKIFPTGLNIIEGRDAVIDYWDQPSDFSISHHKVTPKEIKIWGDEAYDYGYYEGRSMDSLGAESPWKGKYVIIWRKIEDDWKIHLDIWNRIQEDL